MSEPTIPEFEPQRPVATGGLIVSFKRSTRASTGIKRLSDASGMQIASSRDYAKDTGKFEATLNDSDGIYFNELGVAALKPSENLDTAAMMTLLSAQEDVSVRPEFFMYSYSTQERYLAWLQESASILAALNPDSHLAPYGARPGALSMRPGTQSTWGVSAVRADLSSYTGAGIKIAILDTGLDLNHPDYHGRTIVSETFVPGTASAQDGQGHGTHCAGTAAGPVAQAQRPRYGVAPDAELYIGKVLSDRGSGRESWIIAGMEWAIQKKCEIISMSLGRATAIGEQPHQEYEQIGEAALESGSLIIAAAGNESRRQFRYIAPVGAPANSESIMAVAAVDENRNVANFSCGGLNPGGGQIDVCAPGVDVFSSMVMPEQYRRLQGTSMATPHVAGIAALLAQSDPKLRGQKLRDALKATALDIGLPLRDGGAGLVQAP